MIYALAQPEHVDVNEILIRPITQVELRRAERRLVAGGLGRYGRRYDDSSPEDVDAVQARASRLASIEKSAPQADAR